MWLIIVFSFVFYIFVVLWGDVYFFIGMFMIFKILVYVWIIYIGFSEMRRLNK